MRESQIRQWFLCLDPMFSLKCEANHIWRGVRVRVENNGFEKVIKLQTIGGGGENDEIKN